jgi:hypothetical protein
MAAKWTYNPFAKIMMPPTYWYAEALDTHYLPEVYDYLTYKAGVLRMPYCFQLNIVDIFWSAKVNDDSSWLDLSWLEV